MTASRPLSRWPRVKNEPYSRFLSGPDTKGWDWAPRLVSVGIWQGVTLRRYLGARLGGGFFKTRAIHPQAAEATVVVETEQWSADVLQHLDGAEGAFGGIAETAPLLAELLDGVVAHGLRSS